MRVFVDKFGVFIVLLTLTAGILCPSQITVMRTDDDSVLLALDVCSADSPLLSVDSNIPALITTVTVSSMFLEPNIIYRENSFLHKSLFITKLLKPPRA